MSRDRSNCFKTWLTAGCEIESSGVVSAPFEKRQSLSVKEVRELEDVFVAGRRFIQYKNRMLDLQELEKMRKEQEKIEKEFTLAENESR